MCVCVCVCVCAHEMTYKFEYIAAAAAAAVAVVVAAAEMKYRGLTFQQSPKRLRNHDNQSYKALNIDHNTATTVITNQ